MTAASVLRPLATAALLAGAAGAVALGAALVGHVAGSGRAGLWLFAWSAGSAVLLPLLLTAAALLLGGWRRAFIPNAGGTIPGAGQ